jgi:hypothetical protein
VVKEKFGVGQFLRQKGIIQESEHPRIQDDEKANLDPSPPSSPSSNLRRPGPKGRGAYRKRTIDLPLDLDEFVEHARRQHIRPNGQASTAYSHFVEDLIAAERNRRSVQ